ncbi:MAG: alpha/beta fold hydrolase [Gemmatimonadetes bacterium]|nr:alpha/beta fold hydrolase [Gemmatimonadota bacterium]
MVKDENRNGAPLRLHHEVRGSGDPILLLHGFGASLYTWRHLAGPLAAERQVLLLDLKGFGASPKPRDRRYSAFHQAAGVRAFVRAHDLQGLTLAGHSYGGGVALLLATHLLRRDPGRLRRLILISSVAYPQPLPRYIGLATRPFLGPLFLALLPKEFLVRRALEAAFHRHDRISADAIRAYTRPLTTRAGRRTLVQSARQLIPPDPQALISRYRSVTVPTLIVWGREDRIIPLALGERLHRAIPESVLVVLDGCGHVPQEERPEETLQAIRHFLQQTGCTAQSPAGTS